MKKQRGFGFVELLILLTMVGIIAAIAIPSFFRARVSTVTEPFERHFGVSVGSYLSTTSGDSTQWLTPDQKALLRPHVAAQIAAVCADPTGQLKAAQKERGEFLALPSGNGPAAANARLAMLSELDQKVAIAQSIANQGAAACQGAVDAAQKLGLRE